MISNRSIKPKIMEANVNNISMINNCQVRNMGFLSDPQFRKGITQCHTPGF
jgi:hypothetical protein